MRAEMIVRRLGRLRCMGITFIMTGLMAMAFMGLQGIELAKPTGLQITVGAPPVFIPPGEPAPTPSMEQETP